LYNLVKGGNENCPSSDEFECAARSQSVEDRNEKGSQAYFRDQNAMEPSSAPPTMYFSLVRMFWTMWRPTRYPSRGESDVFMADVTGNIFSDFVDIWPSENRRRKPSAENE